MENISYFLAGFFNGRKTYTLILCFKNEMKYVEMPFNRVPVPGKNLYTSSRMMHTNTVILNERGYMK